MNYFQFRRASSGNNPSKNSRLAPLGVLVAAGIVLLSAVWLLWPSTHLNVLLITLDTTRADRLGCYGYVPAETPALDKLARQGVLFERASAAVPLTLPSHATLLTGLYPPAHGLHYNGQHSLGSQIPTLAELLQTKKYQTGAFIGAMVLQKKFGLGRGFDVYDDDMRGSVQAADHLDRMRPGEVVVGSALKWLEQRNPRTPFFCWLHLYDPHHPYEPHDELFGGRFHDQPYDGEIAYIDRQIGRLIGRLQDRGLLERTLIVVAGDHGEGLGEHGESTHSYMLYESTLRVPLIVHAPRLTRAPGQHISVPVSLADVFPTILDAVGISPPKAISGRSLLPALKGQDITAGLCYGETDQPFGEFQFAPLRSLTTTRWKYIRSTESELYDLLEDPAELQNLAATHSDEVQRWDGELRAIEESMSRREAPPAKLLPAEQRALESLGYAGGGETPPGAGESADLPDIKTMIGPVSQYNEALHLMAENDYSHAERILRGVIEAVPNLFIVHHNLGVCLTAQSREEEALACFQSALEIKDDPQTRIELGKTYLTLDRPQEAIPVLEEAQKQIPQSPTPPFYLGEAMRQLGKLDLARERYRAALKIQATFAPARAALSQLERQGW